MSSAEKFDGIAEGYAARTYADPEAYARGRAQLVASLGPRLYPCDEVLDLACGDAHMAPPLEALGLRYRGVDGSEGMIAEARRIHGERLSLEVAPMETLRAARARRGDADPQRDRLPATTASPSSATSPATRRGRSSSTSTRAPTTRPRSSATCGWPASSSRRGAATSCRRASGCPGPVAAGLRKLEPRRCGRVARAPPARAVALRGGAVPAMSQLEKFDRLARGYTEHDYADPAALHRAARRGRGRARAAAPARRDRARPPLRRRQHGRAAARARATPTAASTAARR